MNIGKLCGWGTNTPTDSSRKGISLIEVLLIAKNKNLDRWSRDIRNCEPVGEVHLNREKTLLNI